MSLETFASSFLSFLFVLSELLLVSLVLVACVLLLFARSALAGSYLVMLISGLLLKQALKLIQPGTLSETQTPDYTDITCYISMERNIQRILCLKVQLAHVNCCLVWVKVSLDMLFVSPQIWFNILNTCTQLTKA